MTATDQLSRVTPYLGRLLEDQYIQEQLGQALTELRASSRRAKGRKATEALNDKKLRNQLRAAVKSLTSAGQALNAPPPNQHPERRVAVVLAVASLAAALAWQRRSTGQAA